MEFIIIYRLWDTRAKSFLLKTKYHSGFNSCTKCEIFGDNIDRTICFPNENPEPALRTDEKFYDFKYSSNFDNDYQKGQTILKEIKNLGLVTDVPLDYMHLVCLGVMRKLLLLWLKGSLRHRLSHSQINRISGKLLNIRKFLPSDFARKPRPLKYLKIWKATEFRNFVLYFGPIVLKNILSKKLYKHFLMLHVAIRLLCDEAIICIEENNIAADVLLQKFVKLFASIYGPKCVSYNVHNLNHLVADVRKFGKLNTFSAFQFENAIGSLKKLIRKGDKPLQQLARRLVEFDYKISTINGFFKCNQSGPLVNNLNYDNQYSEFRNNFMHIKCDDEKNDCVLLKSGDIIKVLNFISRDNNYYLIEEKLLPDKKLYDFPYDSTLLNIATVKRTNRIDYWSCNDIYKKVCKLPYDEHFLVIPILHS